MPWSAGEDEQRRVEQSLRLEQVEHEAEAAIGLGDRFAQAVAVRAVVVPGAVGERELVRDEHRRRVRRIVEQHQHLREAAGVEQRLAVHAVVAVLRASAG